MAMLEKQMHKPRRKVPSFSASLLDSIYRSTDESMEDIIQNRRNNSTQVEEEIESLRRAMRIEKWMENYSTTTITPRHIPSNSGSSTDSSFFSSSETESSASKSTPRSSLFTTRKPKNTLTERVPKNLQLETITKHEGRFTRTKSKAMKIYGDLKKVKEPISPGGKIANFLNSIFSPRNLKKDQGMDEWSSIRKSKSMKDTTTCSLGASRSCLSKNASARGNKSKRSVRFCPVSVIVGEDCQPCGEKNVYVDEHEASLSMATVGSQFIKRNIDSFRVYEGKNPRKHEFRECCEDESDVDDKSCASSDLFELENIGRVGFGTYEEELPVYGTTNLKMNQAIASGLVI